MNWTDELWPLVIQLYMKKPVGIKPMYSRDTVDLALEIHIPPQEIYQRMFQLRQPATTSLQMLVEKLTSNTRKLKQTCTQLRSLRGMGNASEFYDGVQTNETFELDFRPVNARSAQMTGRPLYTPVMLIMILDLYFRLIPTTMVKETPDVEETAHLLDITPEDVVDVLEIFQYCDPFVKHGESLMDPMLPPCNTIWQRYASDDLTVLSNLAHQLRAYFTPLPTSPKGKR